MANRKRQGEFESGPPRSPAGPGEPEERTDTGDIPIRKKGWRSRFPGWETHEGRPREARFEHGEDPTHDIRYDTNLNPSMVVPRRLGLVVYILGAVVGFLLLVLLGLTMFYHFMEPAPRSPANPQGQFRPPASQNLVIAAGNHGPGNRTH
ncbi:MAG: hypothetical protein ACM3JB_28510 [Acidobacteriaceae bacterium]